MRVSYQWLKQYIDLEGLSAQEVAEKLTRSGIEVDIVESRNQGITKTVVGYVESKEPHPDADKLSVCRVNTGEETVQIVCGAKNVDAGQKVPVAVVGAKLPGDFKIKKAKLRGQESRGMICSAKELGINDKLLPKEQQEGILVLPESLEVGQDILPVLGLDDEVLELELTPNRSDCLSLTGTAYELAAIFGREVTLPDLTVDEQGGDINERVKVSINAPEHCARYSARLIENITIQPSLQWMQNYLIAAGIRPINNIVDITNYVMLEQGQPLHAFDYEAVAGGNIVVRLAENGEKMTTLDDEERTLDNEMLLITDGEKPIGIAGVMGGANSEVSESTTTILLESAYFEGSSIRKTSRKLGLRSEASLRFEKGVDPEAVRRALDRAAQLMTQYAGGKVVTGVAEQVITEGEPTTVLLRLDRLNNALGTALDVGAVQDIFKRLQFNVSTQESDGETVFAVEVPTRRQDITIEEDLYEEVARLYGYDNIPTTLPVTLTTPGGLKQSQALRRTIRRTLNGLGLHEVNTYSLTSPENADDVEGVFGGSLASTGYKPVGLAMPMSEERSVLRTNLVPHLIEVASYNQKRRNDNVAVFEVGNIVLSKEEKLTQLPEERPVLAGLVTGKWVDNYWNSEDQPVDFYLVKGMLDTLFDHVRVEDVRYEAASNLKGMHPGRTAQLFVGDHTEAIGYVGQLHPNVEKKYDVADAYVFQVDLAKLYSLVGEKDAYQQLPRFPAIHRDLAIVLDEAAPAGKLTQRIAEVGGELLENAYLFDVYTGQGIEEGKKSLAFSLMYRDPEKTLTDEEVSKVHDQVVAALESEFDAKLR